MSDKVDVEQVKEFYDKVVDKLKRDVGEARLVRTLLYVAGVIFAEGADLAKQIVKQKDLPPVEQMDFLTLQHMFTKHSLDEWILIFRYDSVDEELDSLIVSEIYDHARSEQTPIPVLLSVLALFGFSLSDIEVNSPLHLYLIDCATEVRSYRPSGQGKTIFDDLP